MVPVTLPEASTVAMAGSLLLQLPPGLVVPRATVAPSHTADGPVMGAGSAYTVTTCVVLQPEGSVYVMVAVSGPD